MWYLYICIFMIMWSLIMWWQPQVSLHSLTLLLMIGNASGLQAFFNSWSISPWSDWPPLFLVCSLVDLHFSEYIWSYFVNFSNIQRVPVYHTFRELSPDLGFVTANLCREMFSNEVKANLEPMAGQLSYGRCLSLSATGEGPWDRAPHNVSIVHVNRGIALHTSKHTSHPSYIHLISLPPWQLKYPPTLYHPPR